MKKYIGAFALLLALSTAAFAQWQVPDHAVPIGRGPGFTGFKNAAPGTTGIPLISQGAVSDPIFGVLPNAGMANMANGTMKCRSSSGTGTPEDCNYPIINVKDPRYGAVGNGVADDTAAIQAAIDANSGKTIFLPAGTYKVSTTITLSTQGTALVGDGRNSTLIRSTSSTNTIISGTAQQVAVSNMIIAGPASTVMTAGQGINMNGAQGCRLENLQVANVFNGINLDNSTNCLVQFVKMFDIYGNFGIQTANGGGDYIIANQVDPLFYGTTYSFTSGFGAWATSQAHVIGDVVTNGGGNFVTTTNCTTSGTPGGPAAAVFNTTISDGTCTWYYLGRTTLALMRVATSSVNYISSNDFSGPAGNGIIVTGTSDGNDIAFNTIGQIIGASIQLGSGAPTNTHLSGNVLSQAFGAFASGILDANGVATGMHAVDNYINGTGWHGIVVQSANATVNSNHVQGACQITGSCYSVYVAPNVQKFIINNNMLSTTGGASLTGAIRVDTGTSDNYQITGNSLGTLSVADVGSGTNKSVQLTDTARDAITTLNTASNATATGLFVLKNRAGGNTNSGDALGEIGISGFANSAQRKAAQIVASQTAASSGSNIPTKIVAATSNTSGLLNQTWTFNEKGHIAIAASAAPTLTAGCNGAGSAITGNNIHGTATGQTAAATTCTLTFANSGFTATPDCVVSGLNSPLTGAITPSTTTLVVNFASTANYKFTWHCYGL